MYSPYALAVNNYQYGIMDIHTDARLVPVSKKFKGHTKFSALLHAI